MARTVVGTSVDPSIQPSRFNPTNGHREAATRHSIAAAGAGSPRGPPVIRFEAPAEAPRKCPFICHGDAPVLTEGCEPLISRQDAPLRYRLSCAVSRSALPRERFRPMTPTGRCAPKGGNCGILRQTRRFNEAADPQMALAARAERPRVLAGLHDSTKWPGIPTSQALLACADEVIE
jgi:hypothetical protein